VTPRSSSVFRTNGSTSFFLSKLPMRSDIDVSNLYLQEMDALPLLAASNKRRTTARHAVIRAL